MNREVTQDVEFTITKPNLPTLSSIEQDYKTKISEVKKDKSWLRWVIGGGVALGAIGLASLAAAQIIAGATALVVAGATAALGFYAYKAIKKYDPVIQKKMQNHAIKKLIEEAQTNKIETLTAYVEYLDKYLQYSNKLKIKVQALIDKYQSKYNSTDDEILKKEYEKLINKLTKTQEAINKIVSSSKVKKNDFNRMLKIAREKYDFIKETKDIVDFLQNSDSELDKLLVDEGMNQLEKEFLEISATISNIAEQIEDE